MPLMQEVLQQVILQPLLELGQQRLGCTRVHCHLEKLLLDVIQQPTLPLRQVHGSLRIEFLWWVMERALA